MVLIVKEESPMTKKLAVFDLDGTLSRTELFSVPAAQEMERLLGYPVQEASHIIASFGTNYKDTMDAIKRLMISILPMAGKYRQSIWTAPCPTMVFRKLWTAFTP